MVDHTFNGLFSSLGASVALVTITVSVGKLYTEYYFVYIMIAICLVMIALSYVDKVRRQPANARNTLQNYICSCCDNTDSKRIDAVLYNVLDQQSHLLHSGTQRPQIGSIKSSSSFNKLNASTTSLATCSSVKAEEKRAGKRLTLPRRFGKSIKRSFSLSRRSDRLDQQSDGIFRKGNDVIISRPLSNNNLFTQDTN